MKKTVTGSGKFSKEARLAVVTFKTRKKLDFTILEVCDHKNKIFEIIEKQLPSYSYKDIKLESYQKEEDGVFKEINTYEKERIDLKYKIYNKYMPHSLNEILHKTELDIVDSWHKMVESLPEPFKTFAKNLEK